ncbi:hypothetical protein [Mycolicibacterium llatzerense]|uniref:hypothetical protein n=1 Tax=Mycolicibacterium llatzerense TaxID=280871 RepID=UPI0021B52626|nr:hypothetical protein [Mycolicibacterium llatzerense]MCT7369463.1 hypothetical protein [Mycolicibacterium llatzerense]
MATSRSSKTPAAKDLGAPAGRLAQLIVNVKRAEPYVVTDKITVPPMTKTRSKALSDAMTGQNVANALLQQAIRATPTSPEYPTMPQPPEKSVDAEALSAYEKAIAAHTELVAEWEKLHAKWESSVEKIQGSIDELAKQISQHGDDYSRALFGPAHDDVMAYFGDEDVEVWNLFIVDIKEQFGVIPKASQVPDDGRCATCGHIEDEESAGKVPESSI